MIETVTHAEVVSLRDTGPFTRLKLRLTFEDESEMDVSVQRQRLDDGTATAFVRRMLTDEVATIEAAVEEGRAEEMDPAIVRATMLHAAGAVEGWLQPPSTDPIPMGALRTYGGYVWRSEHASNVWPPGTDDLWTQIIPTT